MPSLEFTSNQLYINAPIHTFQSIGIGTSSPASSLHVVGTLSIEGTILPTACNVYDLGSSNYRFRDLYLSGNTIDLEGIQISKNASTGGISIKSATDELLDTSVRNLIAMGSVGIGTSTPSTNMEVIGNVKATYFEGSGARLTQLDAGNVSAGTLTVARGGIGTNTLTNNKVLIGNGVSSVHQATDLHWDRVNSRLGIGTAAPVQALHVTGNIYTNASVGIGVSAPAAPLDVSGTVNATTFTGSGAQLTSLDVGNVSAGTLGVAHGGTGLNTLTANKLMVGNGTIAVSQPTNLHWDNMTSRLGIGSTQPTQTLDVSGNMCTSGSVGVGVATPTHKLHVSGDARVQGGLTVEGAITSSNLYVIGDTVVMNTVSSNTEQMVITNEGTGPALKVTQTGALAVHSIAEFIDAESGSALYISNGGSIGIGTTTSLSKMQIYSTNDGDVFRIIGNAGSESPLFMVNQATYYGSTYVIGVGIGTNNPQQALHVKGQIRTGYDTGSGGVGGLSFEDSTGTWDAIIAQTSQGLVFRAPDSATDGANGFFFNNANSMSSSASTGLLRIQNDGNIGIGTTTALAKTHIYHTGSGDILRVDDSAAPDTTPFIVNQDGNVGIGISTPSQKLDVNGTISATTFSGSGASLTSIPNSATTATSANTASAIVARDASGNFTARTITATCNLVADTATLNGSYLQLGQTVIDQAAYIDMRGDSTYTSYGLRILRGAGANGNTNFAHRGTGDLQIRTLDAGSITLETNSTERVRILSGGNVGIGTATPLARTHIYHGTSTGDILRVDDSAAPDTTPFIINQDGNVGIGSSTPVTPLDVSGLARCKGQMVVYSTTATQGGQVTLGYGNVSSVASQSNATWCMDIYNKVYRIFNTSETGTVTTNFHIAENGNVGIGGTSTPSANLHVIGDTISTGNVGIGTATPLARTHIYHGTSTGDIFRVDDSTATDTTPFVISQDGDVGIGTITPLEKLHVAGNINMYGGSSTTIYLTRNEGGYGLSSGTDYKIMNNGKFIVSQNRTGTGETDLFTVTNAGDVGVGTTTPLAKLHVYSTANADIFRVDDSTAPDTSPFMINKDGNVGIGTTNPLNMFHVNGDTILSGNVGINSTAPSVRLDVGGAVTASGVMRASDFRAGSGTAANPAFTFDGDNNTGMYTAAADILAFSTAGTRRMTIDDTGKVGMGTTNPLNALHVVGTIRYQTAPTGTGNAIQISANGVLQENTSSIRYKENIDTYCKGLADVRELNAVTFNYKDDETKTKCVGYIAEDLDGKGLTEFVNYDSEGLPNGIQYANMIALMANAIKELSSSNQILFDEIAQLKNMYK